jgi:hypothetical protein
MVTGSPEPLVVARLGTASRNSVTLNAVFNRIQMRDKMLQPALPTGTAAPRPQQTHEVLDYAALVKRRRY